MAGRIRTLKPELLEDERVGALSDGAFRLFIAAILSADDFGNFRADPRQLRGLVYWAREEVLAAKVEVSRDELLRCGLIRGYRVREQTYAHIAGWSKHQRIDNAGKARVPKPEDSEASEFHPSSTEIPPRGIDSTQNLAALPPTPTNDTDPDTSVLNSPATNPKQTLFPEPAPTLKPQPKPDPFRPIFDHWFAGWSSRIGGKRKPDYNDKRRAQIRKRLERFSVEELNLASDTLWASDWHVQNGFTTFEQIFYSNDRVEKLLAKAEAPSVSKIAVSVDAEELAKMRNAEVKTQGLPLLTQAEIDAIDASTPADLDNYDFDRRIDEAYQQVEENWK